MQQTTIALVFTFSLIVCPTLSAQDLPFSQYPSGDSSIEEMGMDSHDHFPIRVNSRPITSRLKISLVRPRRVEIDANGNLIIADMEAGAVFKYTPTGDVETVADNLEEPAGLALDATGNLYVANFTHGMSGAGNIIKISPDGVQSVFAEHLGGPTDLTIDKAGHLIVANFEANNLYRYTPDGRMTIVAEDIPNPTAVVSDSLGNIYTVSSTTGTLYQISPMGGVSVLLKELSVPSDLTLDRKGNLVIANLTSTNLTYYSTKNKAGIYATVPKGTISHAFDGDDNLILLNWDYQTAMKITRNLFIDCPHCGAKIPLHFRPHHQPARPAKPML